MTTPFHAAGLARPLAAALLTSLAACGGGGSSSDSEPAPGSPVSAEVARLASANTAVIPTDSTAAVSATLSTAEWVVGAGQMGATIACAGGGTAAYTVSGSGLLQLLNGRLDTGEHYSLVFSGCRSSTGSASVTGPMTLTVVSAAGSDYTVDTATTHVVVALPQRTLTLDGSSRLAHTVTAAGGTTTTVDRWTSPSYSAVTAGLSWTSTFSLSDVDLTRTVTESNGQVTAVSTTGTLTLTAGVPNASFSLTLATQGAVGHDGSGTPTSGSWSITMPGNAITFSVAAGVASIAVDYSADSLIDIVYTFPITQLEAEAG